jgi:hypothetical protein
MKEDEEFVRDWLTGFTPRFVLWWRPIAVTISVFAFFALLWAGAWMMRGNW